MRRMRWTLLILVGFAQSCCIMPGHDVRSFFSGVVVKEKPSVSTLTGTYSVSIDRRENKATSASVALLLHTDGSLSIEGDQSIFGGSTSTDRVLRGNWELTQRDADQVWSVRISADELPTDSWYVLQMSDGSYCLGNFDGDPDQGNVVELRRTTTQTTAPSTTRALN
jgi:hypothetical protein